MKKLKLVQIVISITLICFGNGKSQDYLWPTNASNYLTSSFAEYRPGHFHAGIDIKTWGKIGYKVFAIRDGYISRIRTSPFGYGKVIYQKLDTGETAVYAHLDKFNDDLEKYVKQEQKRKCQYRINKYLSSNRFPVKKGDVIGYTGSTGIGYPHLHFELRDGNNHPINPFLRGFKIKDTVLPSVKAISITPLNVNSRVNSDVVPWINNPTMVHNGSYRVISKPLISGNVGFAVQCFDKADDVNNSFAVHRLDFFVDDILFFSATYNKFSYGYSHFIDFDRDYRLRKRGYGIFQNLYKVKYNKLPFYKPKGRETGKLFCDPFVSGVTAQDNIIGAGEHFYKIELRDFWGNLTTVTGAFIVGKNVEIAADFFIEKNGKLIVHNLRDQSGKFLTMPSFYHSRDSGTSWQKRVFTKVKLDTLTDSPSNFGYLISAVGSGDIVKLLPDSQNQESAFPLFHLIRNDGFLKNQTHELKIKKDFYDNYIRLKVLTPFPSNSFPNIFVQQFGNPPIEIPLVQKDLTEFIGFYPIESGKDDVFSIYANMHFKDRDEINYWEQFDLQTVTPFDGGSIKSEDSNCQVVFEGNKVYENLYLRMEKHNPVNNIKYDAVGDVYELFPKDVLLKGRAGLTLKYPESDTLPEKLGIYSGYKDKWWFIGNKLDTLSNSISTSVSSLNRYTLIRDVTPPVILVSHPHKNEKLTDNMPQFEIKVFDKLSGIASERSITMKLDGQKVIAEYDPEVKSIKYKCEQPLLPGRHQFSVSAVDNCLNEFKVIQALYIIE
ncbi:M23 family metallopeptidase [candidate division KSB1 bacterium]|nr:M23 family metallopeptidase [candidate division KSB1 bacterium]MBL7095345.1 M23 family metallopeptidase [candidate division KSB1 bacterium]